MPVLYMDRVPLPKVRNYIFLSMVLHFVSIYYAIYSTKNPNWRSALGVDNLKHNSTDSTLEIDFVFNLDALGLEDSAKEVVEFMFKDYFCLWVTVNTVYCGLVLFGKLLQNFVFGELRNIEVQSLREKFWNYVLYKFIFIFGVIKVQYMDEVLIWVAWFSVLGFLQLFAKLVRERLDYLTTISVHNSIWNHFKLIGLLITILLISLVMCVVSVQIGLNTSWNIFGFMIAECCLLNVRVVHTLVEYLVDTRARLYRTEMHSTMYVPPQQVPVPHQQSTEQQQPVIEPLQDLYQREENQPQMAQQESPHPSPSHGSNPRIPTRNRLFFNIGPQLELSIIYYVLFLLDMVDLSIELAHYLHMLIWGNIFLSMASLAICMHLRVILSEIQQKVKRYRTYQWVLKHMEKTYPVATAEELEQNSDNCAICWEQMQAARKLPCGHLFHMGCLQQWLEQDTSCPTCRFSLNVHGRQDSRFRQRRGRQHFFHFDGSRYISWLPSFSVEVMHSSIRRQVVAGQNRSQLDMMAHQIQQVFPHYPLSTILDNLRQTGSIDITIENILDGRVIMPRRVISGPAISPREQATQTQGGVDSPDFVEEPYSEHNTENSTEDNLASANISTEESVPVRSISTISSSKTSNVQQECSLPPSRFLSTSKERENVLRNRKAMLINRAKNHYLAKMKKLDSAS